jgi:Holliday junction resolvase RusA-like endonuclease
MIEYQLLGVPTPLHRPRFSRGKVYNDQKNKMLVDYLSIKSQHGKRSLFFDPIHLDITFTFHIPQNISKTKKELLVNKPYVGNVDVDNLLKYIMDVCTGALYNNDNVITSVSVQKIYGVHSKTLFSFTRLT